MKRILFYSFLGAATTVLSPSKTVTEVFIKCFLVGGVAMIVENF
jgi:hypothetical protein